MNGPIAYLLITLASDKNNNQTIITIIVNFSSLKVKRNVARNHTGMLRLSIFILPSTSQYYRLRA